MVNKILFIFFLLIGNLSSARPLPEQYATFCKAWGVIAFYSNVLNNNKEEWNRRSESAIRKFEGEEVGINNLILDLVDYSQKQGKIKKQKPIASVPKSFSWLTNDPFLTKEVKEQLLKLLQNSPESLFNPSLFDQYIAVNYKTEKSYSLILCSFYYQNLVNLFSPFHSDYLGVYLSGGKENEFENMLVNTADPLQLSLLNLNNEFQLQKIENSYVVSAVSGRMGTYSEVKVGDIVLQVDGQDVSLREKKALEYFSKCASGLLSREQNKFIANGFDLPSKNIFSIKTKNKRGYTSFHQCYYRASFPILNRRMQTCVYEIENNILYVVPANIRSSSTVNEIERKLKQVEGVIVDLRLNPKEPDLTESFYSCLFDHNSEAYIRSTPDFSHPGFFVTTKVLAFEHKKPRKRFSGKIIVLIDSYTQGSGEIEALKLRSYPNVRLIGQNSAGSPSRVVTFTCPNNFGPFIISIDKISDKNNRLISGEGIYPDIPVKLDIQSIRQGKDPIYDAAIKWLESTIQIP